jgi:hypothetical protein
MPTEKMAVRLCKFHDGGAALARYVPGQPASEVHLNSEHPFVARVKMESNLPAIYVLSNTIAFLGAGDTLDQYLRNMDVMLRAAAELQ